MATMLDALGFLKSFGLYETVFPFILILALMFGILAKFKPFGEHKYVNATVATIIALFFISMVKASRFLSNFIPMMTGVLIVLVFIVLIFMFMGVDEKTIAGVMTKESRVYGTLIIVIILLVFLSLNQVLPEQAFMTQFPGMAENMNVTLYPADATPSEQAAAILSAQASAIIFSPKVLATLLMLITFGIAAYYIVREKKE